jgi:glutaredoxin 3
MAELTIYTMAGCRHCFRAKRLLAKKGVTYHEIKAGKEKDAFRAEFRERFNAQTFPQILIGDEHIGGAQELAALERSGELDRLLDRFDIGRQPPRASRRRRPLFAVMWRLGNRGAAAENKQRAHSLLLEGLTDTVVEVGAGSGEMLTRYPSSVSRLVAIAPHPVSMDALSQPSHATTPAPRRRLTLSRLAGIWLPAVLSGLTLVAGAQAQSPGPKGVRQKASLRFTDLRPGQPTELVLRVHYQDPEHPGAKPPVIRQVTPVLAWGGRFDTTVPAPCTASDAELQLLGEAACPQDSWVGDGLVHVDTGMAGPGRYLSTDVHLINNVGEQLVLGREAVSGAHILVHAPMREREEEVNFPFIPGASPDGGSVDGGWVRFDRVARAIDGQVHGYVQTPPSCPRSGIWINRIRFTYADGVKQVTETRQHCQRAHRARR